MNLNVFTSMTSTILAIPQKMRSVEIKGFKDLSSLKSPLKWAGGKRWLVNQLKSYWANNKSRRLVEPFSGGLSITLGLMPQKALVNDVNEHLINFYQQLKKGLVVTIRMEYDEKLYYKHRERFNLLIRSSKCTNSEAAQLFYYLNKTGFNGLCRFNQKGEYNVPFGKYKSINYQKDFSEYSKAFSRWDFCLGDFSNLEIRPGDFIYADPPYDVDFTQYSAGGFSWNDQVRAAEWLSKHKGPVILSNQATKRIVRLYKQLGFRLFYFDAPRMINCNGNRDKAKEVLAVKNL